MYRPHTCVCDASRQLWWFSQILFWLLFCREKILMDSKSARDSLLQYRSHMDFLRDLNQLHSPFTVVMIPILICGHHQAFCMSARDTEDSYTKRS